jgi:spermidine synthase
MTGLSVRKIFPLQITVFLAAFLLFQIELIISKIFLPKFGGSYLVWGACVVFFQAILLLGYYYSHLVVQRFGILRYRPLHLVLLFLPLFWFPGRSLPDINAQFQIPMVISVFLQLLYTIGPVFFVLATTSIIFQSWLAASELPERANPYALYAVSNLGSFAALLSYPFFFEIFFDLGKQLQIWRICYLFLLGLHLVVFKSIRMGQEAKAQEQALDPISSKDKLRWLLLSFSGAVMFLSITNIITYEVAPLPLLWIIPLCIYLISFVLVFKQKPWYPNWISEKFHFTIAFSLLFYFLTLKRIIPFMFEVMGFFAILFIICIFCQHELFKHKPRDSRGLTIFYLMISIGSFAGGIFVSWICPLISTSMVEYLFGLFIISLTLSIDKKREKIGAYRLRLIIYLFLLMILWPTVFKTYNFLGLVIIFYSFKFIYSELKTKPQAIFLSILAILCLEPFFDSVWTNTIDIYKRRNYYGIYRIFDSKGKRILMHGTTMHGLQDLNEKKQLEPLAYFHKSTPIGEIMTSDLFKFKRIGIVGLGTGTLAAYGKENQIMDFFELDPDINYIANNYFTYIKRSSGKINLILGDARLSINKIDKGFYDLLVIDAFNGDSIPVHLLTTEAISEYFYHLNKKGIILFHVSNRYFYLPPLLFSNADVLGVYACSKHNNFSPQNFASGSLWVVMTRNSDIYQKLVSTLKWDKPPKSLQNKMLPWSDQYSNLLFIVKYDDIFSTVKNFQPFYW